MDTKAIREAVGYAIHSETFSEWGYEQIRAHGVQWLQQLLDENERLTEVNRALEIDNYNHNMNLERLADELKVAKAEAERLWDIEDKVEQIQADKAVAVEAMKDIVDNSDDQGAIDCASQALERIENSEKK